MNCSRGTCDRVGVGVKLLPNPRFSGSVVVTFHDFLVDLLRHSLPFDIREVLESIGKHLQSSIVVFLLN